MSDFITRFKNLLRPIKHLLYAGPGFAYDYYRYFKYAGWSPTGAGKRDYRAVKIYHRLEKSLSFRQRRLGSGAEAVFALSNLFLEQGFDINKPGYQERIGLKVLGDFLREMSHEDPRIEDVKRLHEQLKSLQATQGGVFEYTEQKLADGRLDYPEKFFLSRYSVRDFQSRAVEREYIVRAVSLAMKSPSVCSRQAWHVYHVDKREVIDKALFFQNGNRGFGHEVPCLLILTSDLAAFDTASERYQHWIDGGMFSMSITLALHSLGLASCCLNWSKGPADDIRFRNAIPIKNSHSVLMMMAVGYASEEFKACCSVRRPMEEIFTHIE